MQARKGVFIVFYYKFLGIVLFIGGIVAARWFYTSISLDVIAGDNEFFKAMINSPGMKSSFETLKLLLSFGLAAIGISLGSLCFGVGQILRRLRRDTF